MAQQFEFTIDGQVIDTVTGEVKDTISRRTTTIVESEATIWRDTLNADETTEADVTIPVSLPAYVYVINRDATNDLLIGPKVAGVLARAIQIPSGLSAFFPLDSTATLRYKSLVANVDFDIRAWPI